MKLSSMTWNPITCLQMKQLTWLRIVHYGDWCLLLALRTPSDACQKWMNEWIHAVVLARAQKVAEWKDRKEAILRGEMTVTEDATDNGVDSIYDVQEEVSNILLVCSVLFLGLALCIATQNTSDEVTRHVTAEVSVHTVIHHCYVICYCKTLIFCVHLIFANFASSIKSRNKYPWKFGFTVALCGCLHCNLAA